MIGGATGLAGATLAPAQPHSAGAAAAHGRVRLVERRRDRDRAQPSTSSATCISATTASTGRAVFPFAGAMELMAEAAVAANPALELAGLRDIRVLKGVTVDEAGYAVRVAAVRAPDGTSLRDHDRRRSRAAARTTAPSSTSVSRATAVRRGRRRAELPDLPPFPMTVEDAYRDLLFHGPLFQRIARDRRHGRARRQRGAAAVRPARCIRGAEGAWLLDPDPASTAHCRCR